MKHASEMRVEPAAEILAAARAWMGPVREALGPRWLAGYLTGSVLTQGFDARRSRINVLVIVRELESGVLDPLAAAIPTSAKPPRFEPLFVTAPQMRRSLDVFPIEWTDILERRLLIEGEDVLAAVEVPRTYLRHQLEHEMRGKHLQLRQSYLAASHETEALRETLARLASGFHALFRTILRLRGETPPASTERVIERISDLFGLDARALLGAWMVRYAERKYAADELRAIYRSFLHEIERLIAAVDELKLP